jgi:predicted NBD/HSP70 family sugar kinase
MPLPVKATHQQTRAHNSALVLRALYDHGPVSRAEVARRTGLTRTTVSDLVNDLLADGLAEEIGRGPSTGGKSPILVRLGDDARVVIALDVGERVFEAAIVNLRGVVRRRVSRVVDGLDGDAALAVVHELIDELRDGPNGTLLGIGVGTPGLVDTTTGTIRWAVNLDWQDLPLAAILRERYGVAVVVANDSRAAALAVHLFDGESRPNNLVAVKVGRGIGAGVVIGGQLFHGDSFGAGEIGHIVVDPAGERCHCGRLGCLETVAAAPAILRRATEAARSDPSSGIGRRLKASGTRRAIELTDLRDALDEGDPEALRIVEAAGRALGAVLAALTGVLDIHRIVLLGSVSDLGEPWLRAVRGEALSRSLGPVGRATDIDLVRPSVNEVVLGASALLITNELGLVVQR